LNGKALYRIKMLLYAFFNRVVDVLLNVFLAIAVDNISLEDDENKAEEEAAATETGYVY